MAHDFYSVFSLSSVGPTVWEGCRGVDLLEEVY